MNRGYERNEACHHVTMDRLAGVEAKRGSDQSGKKKKDWIDLGVCGQSVIPWSGECGVSSIGCVWWPVG